MAGLEYLTTATVVGGSTRCISIAVSSYTDYKDLVIMGGISAGNGLDSTTSAKNSQYDLNIALNDPTNAKSGTPFSYQYQWLARPTMANAWVARQGSDYDTAYAWAGYCGHQWHNSGNNTYDGPWKYGMGFLRMKLPSFQTGRPLMTWEYGWKGQWEQSGGSQLTLGAIWRETDTGVSSVQVSTSNTSWEFQAGSYLAVFGLNA